jgi:hypothetical protein
MRKALAERELGCSFSFGFHLFDPEFQKLLNLRVIPSQHLQGALQMGNRACVNVVRCVVVRYISVFSVALYACNEVFC